MCGTASVQDSHIPMCHVGLWNWPGCVAQLVCRVVTFPCVMWGSGTGPGVWHS